MSGLALKIQGCDFSSLNLGQITAFQHIPVTALTIDQSGAFSGKRLQLNVAYTPSNTTRKGVVWSITSGGEYATIDSDGLLVLSTTANASNVTVKVTSIYDSSVYATANFVLTYSSSTYQVTQTLSNATSSNSNVYAEEDEQYTTTLTPSSGYEIGDFRVMMGGVNVTSQCTLVRSSNDPLNQLNQTWTITTPAVTGDVVIENEAHLVYRMTTETMYMGNISTAGKCSASTNFIHRKNLVPAAYGDTVKVYICPATSTYTDTFISQSTGNENPRYSWIYKPVEVNTTDSSIFAANANVSSYCTIGAGTQSYIHMRIVSATDIMVGTYEIANANTLAIHFNLGMYDNGGGGNIPMSSSGSLFGSTFKNATATAAGSVLKANGDPFGKITVNETTLEGGWASLQNAA